MKTLPLLVALLAAGSASAAQVWVASAAQKIRPNVQPPASASAAAKLAAAKNEFEAFQVVITGQAAGVSMTFDKLSDGAGHTISGRDVVLYREALINVPYPSGGDGGAGVWPDALVPDVDPIVGEKRNAFPFDVPANESRAVLVDLHAPQGTPAGKYTGTLHVSGGVTQDVSVELVVWDFEVPSTSTLRTAFGMTWNGPCMGHGDGSCSGGDSDMKLRARYVQAALDNHVSIHQPYFTSTVDASGNENWGAFDLYAGPFLDGTADTRLKGAKLTSVSVNGAPKAAVVSAWSKHFKAKGWSDTRLFDYVCDEPPLTCQWSDIPVRVAEVHAGDPTMPTLVTTTTWDAQSHGVSGIDLFVPVINFVEGKPGSPEAGNQRAKFGNDTWWYQSCMSHGCSGVGGGLDGTGETGWPTYAIDSDATRHRSMEWMSFTYDMSGELYYEMTQGYFGGDPWVYQTAFGGTGDGTLFYPGTPAKIGGQTEIPVESLRLKAIRDGMEDYELLNLAKKLGVGDQAKAIALGLFPKTYQSSTSPAGLDNARGELAGLILHALGKDAQSGGSGSTGTPCDTTACTSSDPAVASPQAQVASPGGGCATAGMQSLWLAVPALALFALRRRRAA
ncbi:MAG: DUF4091 domain-containing protein [Myxococcales bacterium]